MITAVDEALHAPGADPAWQESYYFNWADPEGRHFGLTRIGFNPLAGRVDGLLLTVRDGRLEYVYPGIGLPYDPARPQRPGRGLRAGSLAFTMREPLQRWNIRLDGRNSVDLNWTASSTPHDFHDGPNTYGEAGPGSAAAMHFEQAGTVTGSIRVHGSEYQIDALGQRDKSWGARDWSGISGWDWITGHFGPDLAFNATLSLVGRSGAATGFVHRNGVNVPLADAQVDYEWTRTPHVPGAARLLLADVDGGHYDIRATALAQVPLVKNGLFLQETHTRFETTLDGVRRTGVGVMEHAWHAGRRGSLRRLNDLAPVLVQALRGRVA